MDNYLMNTFLSKDGESSKPTKKVSKKHTKAAKQMADLSKSTEEVFKLVSPSDKIT